MNERSDIFFAHVWGTKLKYNLIFYGTYLTLNERSIIFLLMLRYLPR